MDATEVAINSEVRAIAQKLLSKDPILFNSTLNAYFASDATYHGHALRIRGVSQIKHAAWLWNIGDWGHGASLLADKDVEWDDASKTAKIRALRHLRPFFFPLFTFAVPVTTVMRFEADKSTEGQDAKETLLYATHWDDQWPIQEALEHLPIIGLIIANFVTPLASFFAVMLANFLFAINARVGSIERQWVEPGAERFVLKTVKNGFQRGIDVGEGWGESIVALTRRVAYHPLKGVEFGARTAFSIANAVLPVHLPAVSVFDDAAPKGSRSAVRRMPSSTRQQTTHEDHGERSASSSDNEGSGADSSATDLTLPAVVPKSKSSKKSKKHKEGAIKPATVEVGPTVDDANGRGREGTHTVPAHQFNEAGENPHHGTEAKRESSSKSKGSKKSKGDDEPSLFDKVHDDPKALRKAEKAAAAAEGHSPGKSSKKKHGKEHAHPPSFKESLAQ